MKYSTTQDQRDTIIKKVEECIHLASVFYKVDIEMPHVQFDAKGTRVAGWAQGRTWTVNFHAGFVSQFFAEYIEETVAHEVAHLIDYRFNPETRETSIVRGRNGQLRRTKRSIHGPTWKRIMLSIYRTDPERCHNWKLDGGAARKAASKSPYEYECSGCKISMTVGLVRHRKMQADPKQYWHRGCKGTQLVFVRDQRQPAAFATVRKTVAKTPPAPKVGTKADRAKLLLSTSVGQSNAERILMLMSQLDMRKAGATTYFYKYK